MIPMLSSFTFPGSELMTAQINDGSPDIFAIRAFNTLEGLDVPNPIFWENIGTQIVFKVPNPTPPIPLHQPYPTYYEYHNGAFIATYPEFPAPTGNFNTAPYPFGTVTSVGLYPYILNVSPGTPSIPGGRNGVAGLPPGPTVRNPPPPYTVLP